MVRNTHAFRAINWGFARVSLDYTGKKDTLLFVEKIALIVSDGADSTRKMAEAIALSLDSPWKTVVMPGENFDVTQLLAAAACFLGAESPNPPCFSRLCNVLAHINLAGRPWGIFSSSEETAAYLRGILHDSEAALYPDTFFGEGDVKAWTEKVLAEAPKS